MKPWYCRSSRRKMFQVVMASESTNKRTTPLHRPQRRKTIGASTSSRKIKPARRPTMVPPGLAKNKSTTWASEQPARPVKTFATSSMIEIDEKPCREHHPLKRKQATRKEISQKRCDSRPRNRPRNESTAPPRTSSQTNRGLVRSSRHAIELAGKNRMICPGSRPAAVIRVWLCGAFINFRPSPKTDCPVRAMKTSASVGRQSESNHWPGKNARPASDQVVAIGNLSSHAIIDTAPLATSDCSIAVAQFGGSAVSM